MLFALWYHFLSYSSLHMFSSVMINIDWCMTVMFWPRIKLDQ